MNLLLRLMWIVLRARFAARHTPLTAPIRRRFRVWLTDQDMFLHMTNSRYLSFSDLGRVDLFTRSGLNRLLRQKGWRTSISAQTMTINRMLKTPNAFELETRVHGWNDQFLVVEQTFLRKGRNAALLPWDSSWRTEHFGSRKGLLEIWSWGEFLDGRWILNTTHSGTCILGIHM